MEHYIELPIKDNSFEYKGKTYDCSLAIKRDIKQIIQEAEISHKESFDKTYKRESLAPDKVRVYLEDNGNLIFGMVLYLIDYRYDKAQRWACGNYYPIWQNLLCTHPYQGSICW